jgi:hypothetical protein
LFVLWVCLKFSFRGFWRFVCVLCVWCCICNRGYLLGCFNSSILDSDS